MPQRKNSAQRDHFAGLAMQALIGDYAVSQAICDRDPRYNGCNFAEVVALNAYDFADAMLRVRSKKPAPAKAP